MRSLFGFLAGVALLGGYIGYQEYRRSKRPCLDHCGVGTECVEGVCVVVAEQKRGKRYRKRRRRGRRRRGRRRRRGGGTVAANDEPRTPTAADLKKETRGPSLRGAVKIDMNAPAGRTLSTAEITARFRKHDDKIVACIDKARGDYELARARMKVAFRIERSGAVKKVRVTAPAVLQRGGIYGCVAKVVRRIRFPSSSGVSIMTFPFALR